VEAARPNARTIDHRQCEHGVDVSHRCFVVSVDIAELLPHCAPKILTDERSERSAVSRIEKEPGGPHALERVPLDGIVTRGDHEATTGVVMLDRHLTRRCGRQSEVDDACAD
jgi:hypothetical protein